MKKIIGLALIASSIIINSNFVYADTKLNDSNKYELKQPNTTFTINNNEEYMPEEFIQDIKEEAKIYTLEPKTESEYEIAIAHKNGEYSYVESSDNLSKAIDKVKKLEQLKSNSEDMYVVIDNDGLVTYAPQAVARLVAIILEGSSVSLNGHTANMYTSATSSSNYTYLNHGYVDDMPIIEQTEDRVKVEVAGYTGWIEKDEWATYKVNNNDEKVLVQNIIQVPLNQVTEVNNLSYYKKNSAGDLVHYISTNITESGKGFSRIVGKAPSYMKVDTTYYSYDGNYFYTDIQKLLTDAQSNNHNSSVNKSNPYYNYYTYLPARTKTSYTAKDIDKYLENYTSSNSILRGKGAGLIEAQTKYGINASYILGIAMNESGKGTSTIATSKNNIFGLNAVDLSPGESANYFESVEKCIEEFAKHWMSTGYINPNDWRYQGGFLGNKSNGANVKYASDPYWGEKAATFMYEMDKYLGGTEYGKYKLGIYTGTNTVTNSSGQTLYEIKSSRSKSGMIGDVVAIIDSSSGKYQINADRPVVMSTDFNGSYSWTNKYYINSNNVKIINNPYSGALSQNQINAINKFEQFYIYGTFNKPSVDLSNSSSLIKTYSQANNILRKEEQGQKYDRQKFLDAWNQLSASEKTNSQMKKIQNEYLKIVSITEAAQASFKFYEDIVANSENLISNSSKVKSLYNKDNMTLGARGKVIKEYSEATKYGENSKNSSRMSYINEKYLDGLNFLEVCLHLFDYEIEKANEEASKIKDSNLKKVAYEHISKYQGKQYTQNQKNTIKMFEQFYIYGEAANPILNLSLKTDVIKKSSDATNILRTTVDGKKYDRQKFLDTWAKMSTKEKSHTDMQKIKNDYLKIISITEAAQACLKFYENVSTNANNLMTNPTQVNKLYDLNNMSLGARGKAYKEYNEATKYGENSKNSSRMSYINEKYLDTLNFLKTATYLSQGKVNEATKTANEIKDSSLKKVALSHIK